MQTNDNKAAGRTAQKAAPAAGYKVTDATAKLLDCLRTCNALSAQIYEAMQLRYGDTLSDDDIVRMAKPYNDAIAGVEHLLHEELTGVVSDALLDADTYGKADSVEL